MTLDNFSARMFSNAMNQDQLSATLNYVIWREESLWNVDVLLEYAT